MGVHHAFTASVKSPWSPHDVPVPVRMQHFKRDPRGHLIPWFVPFINGVWEFRAMDGKKFEEAIKRNKCWMCGGPLGVHKVFVTGPMCVVNRINAEPPCHFECAEFAVKVCPFLSHPRAKRNEKDLDVIIPDRRISATGIRRNPGCAALYTTGGYKLLRMPDNELLFDMDAPTRVRWYCEGRQATRAEVLDSIESGLPLLREKADCQEAHDEITAMYHRALPLLPVA